MDLLQVFYVSRATPAFDSASVQKILRQSRRNNQRDDLTGCLLFSGKYFGQVLEGRRDVVMARLAIIGADPRHSDVRLLVKRSSLRRSYGEWSMAYLHDLDLEDKLEALLLDPTPTSEMIDLMERMRPDTVMGALR